LPVFIVICNDCTAYIFGFFFGHTPLIELSPKKTWEGFMGAFASTMAFAWIASYFFAQDDFFRCPVSVCMMRVLHA
jgi:phosphatidate cytidylyltransferase